MRFTRKFIVSNLGVKFYDTLVKPKVIEELMSKQKEMLKYVQPLVDWEKEVREQKKRTRFGHRAEIPPRPKISDVRKAVFPCPKQGCRGFVENGRCGTCSIYVCQKCREPQENGHVCKVENLQSIALLMSDSRSCPRCCAIIQRTMGCNHMHCTNCWVYFDWDTGRITETSTNGHYRNLQRFSENVPVRDVANAPCTDRGFSLYRDHVTKDDLNLSEINPKLVSCLWDDSNSIRLLKRKMYNEPEIESKYTEALQDLQIKFLIGDVTEQNWSRSAYQHLIKKQFSFMYSDVLNIYLSTVDLLQTQISNQYMVSQQYRQLVELCNQSFESIQEECGGQLHHIRHPDEDVNNPAFV